MSRGTYKIERKISGSWVDEGDTIYRPNEDFSRNITSSMVRVPLADGSNGYVTKSTKYVKEPLLFAWLSVDRTYKNQIDNYVENGYDLKITDHWDNVYTGRFTSLQSPELVGQVNEFNVYAAFEIIPSLA